MTGGNGASDKYHKPIRKITDINIRQNSQKNRLPLGQGPGKPVVGYDRGAVRTLDFT